jgi:hypothetical protein
MKAVLNHNSPDFLERKRINEIRSLSYEERLQRLFQLIKVSYELKKLAEISKTN